MVQQYSDGKVSHHRAQTFDLPTALTSHLLLHPSEARLCVSRASNGDDTAQHLTSVIITIYSIQQLPL